MMLCLVPILVLAAELQPPAVYAPNDELHALLMEAGENNPAVRMRYEEYLAALERIPQAKSLEDPMFSYGQFLVSDVNRFRVMVSQKFPWFGTLKTRGQRSALEAEAAMNRYYTARNAVFADLKTAYFDYAYLAEQLDIIESQAGILKYTEEVISARYGLGLAREDELLRVQMQQADLQNDYDTLLDYRPALAARLNQALGREAGEEPPWPQDAPLPAMPPPAPIVLAQIRLANPDLAAYDNVIASKQKAIELARKEGYPDFTIGLEFMKISKPRQIRPDRPYPATLNAAARTARMLSGQMPVDPINGAFDAYSLATAREPMAYSDGGEDNITLSVTMNVPIWRKRVRAGIDEAKHLAMAAEEEKQAAKLDLDAQARMALYEYKNAARRVELYEQVLLPKAEQSFESIQTSYATSASAGYLDVQEAVEQLLTLQLETARARRDLHLAAARIEFLMGRPWLTGEDAGTSDELDTVPLAIDDDPGFDEVDVIREELLPVSLGPSAEETGRESETYIDAMPSP